MSLDMQILSTVYVNSQSFSSKDTYSIISETHNTSTHTNSSNQMQTYRHDDVLRPLSNNKKLSAVLCRQHPCATKLFLEIPRNEVSELQVQRLAGMVPAGPLIIIPKKHLISRGYLLGPNSLLKGSCILNTYVFPVFHYAYAPVHKLYTYIYIHM